MIAPVDDSGHTAFGGEAAPCWTLGSSAHQCTDLKPLDAGLETTGQTYDFTIADITESRESYRTGGFIPFRAMYAA
jgi:hypothetical protein